jgi:histidyl-tRNA synthetase
MTDKVEARISRGLRDLPSDQMLARRWMIDTVRGVYERYGFVPLETPAIEYLDVLLGSSPGPEASQSIFTVTNPKEEEEKLGLRFDLTVPLARFFSQHRDLPRPFRRYQVSPVWRTDKPDPGRYREFTQLDLDSVGVEPGIADTEIIAGMCDSLSALEVGPFRVRFSSRGILNVLLAYAGIPAEQGADVFRVLDKLDKAGPEKVRRELTTGYVDVSGDPIPGLGLSSAQADKIERFLKIRSDDRREVVAELRQLFAGVEGAEREIGLAERISSHLYGLGYGEDQVSLDLSIARGLAYYTGPVFEAVLLDAPGFGSVFGGGRYDGLVMRFLGEKVPAVGASMGVDRLLAALVHLGRTGKRKATAKVLIIHMDPHLEEDYLAMTWELRRAGVPAELYLGAEKRTGKQLKYADAWGVPIAVLYGSNEKQKGTVTLKDMDAGRRQAEAHAGRQEWLEERPGQREVPRSELVSAVKEMLARMGET